MKIKKVVGKQAQQINHVKPKEVFEFKDLSGLPKGVREAMHPLKEHVREVSLDTISDAIQYIENPGSINQAIVLVRLQKLQRLLNHLKGEKDENLHSDSSSNSNPQGEVLDGPYEVRGVDHRGTAKERGRDNVLERLRSAKCGKG